MNEVEYRKNIEQAIHAFAQGDLTENALSFFEVLGYDTTRRQRLRSPSRNSFRKEFVNRSFNEEKANFEEWKYVDLLFQLSSEEMTKQLPIFNNKQVDQTNIQAYLFFVIELSNRFYTRTELSNITREVNRQFLMPAMILFKHGNTLTLSVINRRLNLRDGNKDVLEKITLIKDVSVREPHRAHIDILVDLSLAGLKEKETIENFVQLHNAWQNTLNISILNTKFYNEISEWFDDAIEKIKLPDTVPNSIRQKDFTIRLIARLIFVWFLKELKVVSEELLVPTKPSGMANDLIKLPKKGSSYYKFVLQNLFFNALNKEQADRKDAINDFDVFASSFSDAEKIKNLILGCPFLNGGLFDEDESDFVLRKSANNAFIVPDDILIGEAGLNSVLSHYKFTTTENTPFEEEIAVEPEMLGRIFENLLAEQSDDTKDAAKKNKGAFYTPRPVVSYMCKNVLLRHIGMDITPENGKAIVKKLMETTIIDPACGSGAFPMGMLEEMMVVLDIVDPDGRLWFAAIMKQKENDLQQYVASLIEEKQVRYVKKLVLLRNCLCGIDILNYAVEISKLRCWLSLIVEQNVDFGKPNYNLKPLPNLEFKFYKRDSLLRCYDGKNINQMLDKFDKDKLLKSLVDLEYSYFITTSDKYHTKEGIKKKIETLLDAWIDNQIKDTKTELKLILSEIIKLQKNEVNDKEIKKAEKKAKVLAEKVGSLARFKNTVKDYFIERVVFPGIFNDELKNPGFDIVIGNPPYVNTKLINAQKLTEILKEEYGYCDDLYNHFTIRGMELLKQGGHLSYITSDTFITIQTKENMRRLFLGLDGSSTSTTQQSLFGEQLAAHNPAQQIDLYGKVKPVQTELVTVVKETEQTTQTVETKGFDCRLHEIINLPKAFAAMVDTAIFTVQKIQPNAQEPITYIDLRFPTAKSFGISDEEWKAIKESKSNVAGWEKILSKSMAEIQLPLTKADPQQADWFASHSCNGHQIESDQSTTLEKYRLPFTIYRQCINYSLFAPNKWNCKVFDKILKPVYPVYKQWWDKIETSGKIEINRVAIQAYLAKLQPNEFTLFGLLTDGGVGLQTGDNGRFVGVFQGTTIADRTIETRPEKLMEAVAANPAIKKAWKELKDCNNISDYVSVLAKMDENEIRSKFDDIKGKFGRGVFGKGYLYRVIEPDEEADVSELTDEQKKDGIKSRGKEIFVPYDKGDKDGNRWDGETQYGINWSYTVVQWLKENSGGGGNGMPVVRNPQFYFREGLCWSDILNPNAEYIKCRMKRETVNDVKSMSLYDQSGLGDRYLITIINSYTAFKIVREFLNSSVSLQMNDLRKLPVKIPSKSQLNAFKDKFNDCLKIKLKQFSGKIKASEADAQLAPIEREIDKMVEELYDIG